ncbi:MAG: hypothetical protein QXU98_05320 [Candidatus Parvarchaeota archaeon]
MDIEDIDARSERLKSEDVPPKTVMFSHNMASQSSSSPPPASKSHKTRNIAIIGVVVLVIIIIGIIGLASLSTPSVTVTTANLEIIYPNGATNGYLGPSFQALNSNSLTLSGGQQFTETITLNNQASIFTSHTIYSITTNTPGFSVVSVSPQLPFTLAPGASAAFTITITSPNTNYNGPVTIVITTS